MSSVKNEKILIFSQRCKFFIVHNFITIITRIQNYEYVVESIKKISFKGYIIKNFKKLSAITVKKDFFDLQSNIAFIFKSNLFNF